MTSDEERREVARKLKDLVDGHAAVECSAVAKALNLDYEVHGSLAAFSSDAVSYVADLIKPEANDVTFKLDKYGEDGEEVYPVRFWICSKCGEETIMMYDEGKPVACPYCGARNTEVD